MTIKKIKALIMQIKQCIQTQLKAKNYLLSQKQNTVKLFQ